ncbi:MAG: hypothetical protein ABI833_17565 [Acidobacteriota bacterium]
MRRILTLALLASPAFAADWVEYRSGPLHIFSDAGDKAARERLTQLEQIRFVLGGYLGKNDLTTVWPIHLVLFANQKEYGPHALPQALTNGGSAELAAWTADVALPRDLLRAITRRLLDDNAGRMPDEIENGICDLFSTLDVNATRVNIGAPLPPGELTGDRLRGWAKLEMLATQPEYSGKLRTYINNMQNAGEEDQAAHNAFDMKAGKLAALADGYLKAGKFEAAPVNGKALNPNRDFIEKDLDKATVEALLAELDAKGKSFPPDSPRGLLAKNTLPALELAIRANPRWAEPHFKGAALESDAARKIAQLKMAATLAPRNAIYWQTLATSQAAANLFADAEKSWTAAERAAGSRDEKRRIHQAKLALEENRAEFEAAEKRRQMEEEARDLQRVKDNALAEIRAAEQAANRRMAVNAGNVKGAVPYFGDPTGQKVSGTLTRVECLNSGPLRLTIQQAGFPIRLLIRNPKQLTVAADSGQAEFACGVQKPVRKIEVQHDGKVDARLSTMGDILVVKFP